jgi:hypothetical protein
MSTRIHAPILALMLMAPLLGACNEDATSPAIEEEEEQPVEESGEEDVAKYVIMGSDMGQRYQHIHISRDGEPVTDATVTLNGVDVPLTDAASGYYHVVLPAALQPLEEVRLEVRIDTVTITAIDQMPEAPLPIAPDSSITFAVAAPIAVAWTSATDPKRFRVIASYSCGDSCGTSKSFDVAGDARAFTIPGGTFASGTDVQITVFAYNDGEFDGPADESSQLRIRGEPFVNIPIRVES